MIEELEGSVSTAAICRALHVPRSSLYRARQPRPEAAPRPTPPRALCPEEKAAVRAVLNSQRFLDMAQRTVYATLLDEGIYHCHWRTMYRILAEHDEVHERRQQRRHPVQPKPELRASGARQLWSWDIVHLKGPHSIYYYLYVILDVFSRYVPGWLIAAQESAELARQLIDQTCASRGLHPSS